MKSENMSANVEYTSPVLLETKSLRKYFTGKKGLLNRNPPMVKAVDDIDLTIQKGETLGLVGESGCGKSTLGRTILKLIPMTSGQVLYEGQDIAAYDKKEDVGNAKEDADYLSGPVQFFKSTDDGL